MSQRLKNTELDFFHALKSGKPTTRSTNILINQFNPAHVFPPCVFCSCVEISGDAAAAFEFTASANIVAVNSSCSEVLGPSSTEHVIARALDAQAG